MYYRKNYGQLQVTFKLKYSQFVEKIWIKINGNFIPPVRWNSYLHSTKFLLHTFCHLESSSNQKTDKKHSFKKCIRLSFYYDLHEITQLGSTGPSRVGILVARKPEKMTRCDLFMPPNTTFLDHSFKIRTAIFLKSWNALSCCKFDSCHRVALMVHPMTPTTSQ